MANIFMMVLMVFVGAGMGVQAGINSNLSKKVGSFEAGLVSTIGSSLICMLLMLALRSGHLGAVASIPKWQLIGGVCGSIMIFSTILCSPRIGSYAASILLALGQLSCTIILDHFGLLGLNVRHIDVWRVLGFSLMICGAFSIFKKKLFAAPMPAQKAAPKTGNDFHIPKPLCVLMMIVGGCALGVQAAVNASLSKHIGVYESSFISTGISMLSFLIIVLIQHQGKFRLVSTVPKWKLTGGLFGAAMVASTILSTPHIGAYNASISMYLGQLGCTMVLDHFGAFNMPVNKMDRWRVIGFILMISGVICVYKSTFI